jgi:hypothetical protein
VVGPVLVENVSIEGFSHGIAAGGAVVTVRNSVVSQNNKGVWGATVRLEDSSVVDNLNEGLFGATHASLRDSVISGNGTTGVEAESVEMLRSEVNDNGGPGIDGFIAKAYKIRYSSVSGNAQGGILALSTAGRLVLLYSSIQDNGGHGVDGFRSVKLKESSVSGNSGAGIRHDTTLSNVRLRMRVAASTVTGNGTFGVLQFGGDHSLALQRAAVVSGNATNVDCGVTMACADVGSATLPKVSSSATCQTSHVHDSGIPGDSWGVCTND